ncbi:hypothetical protein [Niabella aurantiaca]|uniref:hypothetical protein n=1 Tax=Niabella aurantiaca TaxID=379900 RepID=UPI0003768A25|nr:hypothetical protein [Niabella aurantiaca]
MFITFFIISRILLIACFVLVIGYVFGSFSGNKTLTLLTRISAILLLVGFIAVNIVAFRFRAGGSRFHNGFCKDPHPVDSGYYYRGNRMP